MLPSCANPFEDGTAAIASFLSHNPSIKYFRLQFVDLSGILRGRFLTVEHLQDVTMKGNYATVAGTAMHHAVNDAVSSIAPPFGLFELVPDWQSLRLCTFAPGHASVMCSLRDVYSADPFNLCPRGRLAEHLDKWQNVNRVAFLTGFEIEFLLLDASAEISQTADSVNAWSTTAGLRGSNLKLVEDIVQALQDSGISVQLFHTTAAPSQFQIATGPARPLEAVDSLMQTHECIRHLCARYGLRATMAPKPLLTKVATGAHTHISMGPPEKRDSFLAGILEHLPAISALSMPSYDSYYRAGLYQCPGAWVAWGTENRHVPIRAIKEDRWEIRSIDATANFYLALLTILAAGVRGIEQNMALNLRDCRLNPSKLSQEEITAHGIVTPMPKSMKECLMILKDSTVFDAVLGGPMKTQYIAMKELDEKDMSALDDRSRRDLYVKMF
ncbi:MAG: hypothetical protein M1820_003584 [Bogoriella megaspora]|nr:MAG: hypothetical protein M1820_003584 [Bogoriella megaspora]